MSIEKWVFEDEESILRSLGDDEQDRERLPNIYASLPSQFSTISDLGQSTQK